MRARVLVVPEDFRQDQYVLKPLVTALVEAAVGPGAVVRVCQDPLLGGVSEALKPERIREIVATYQAMVDLILIIVDRDGEEGRRARLDFVEREAAPTGPCALIAEQAWQEVEVWVLAAMTDWPKGWRWKEIRAERDPKERFFGPYAAKRGLAQSPYEGRDTLAREAARSYKRVRELCEEVAALEARVRDALLSPPAAR